MFLKKDTIRETLTLLLIASYAFYVTWISGNIGVIPIDSFGFLDTGHSILNGKLPIRDFWIFTGLLVDYMGAFFLSVFGNNWNSYLFHSSFMNILAVSSLYIFLKNFNIQKIYYFLLHFIATFIPCFWNPFCLYSRLYFFINLNNDTYFSNKKS